MKKLASILTVCCLALTMATTAMGTNTNQLMGVALWNAVSNQASMGNIATGNNPQALYNPTTNTLQIATNPVDVSGYLSGIQALRYDTTGKGNYADVSVVSIATVDTGTKNDGTNHTVTFLSSFQLTLPAYITGQGIEFIPIQMSVPHTPMDVVVGSGYLDARLRIDWSAVQSTDLVTLIPDTTISTGQVEQVRLSQNGIQVKADTTILPSDCQLTVTKVTAGSDYDLAKSALGADVADFELYSLSVTLGGAEATPSGSLEVVFPYSDLSNLYRINDTGTKTTLRGTVSSDGYSILSRSLGLFAVVGGTPVASPFTDVSTSHWAYDAITNAVSAGLFNGTTATTFSPGNNMTNAMVITVLHRMAGSPATENDGAVWYAQAMAWGYANGIIGGYTDFVGSANVSREGLATMIYRYEVLMGNPTAGTDLSGFADSGNISSWATDGLAWANAAGIVNGTTAATIAPQNQATRAQVATMLWRYANS